MRLLLLSIEFPPGPGGMGVLAYQVARGLTEFGWEVTVSTPQTHADAPAIERFNAAQRFDIQRLRQLEPAAWEGMYRLTKVLQNVRCKRPDVVLAVGKPAVWLAAMLSLVTRIPMVAVGIGSEFLGSQKMDRSITRRAFGRAQCVIAISQFALDLINTTGIRSSRVKVVPCGADAHLYRPGLSTGTLREQLGLGEAKVILTVGQLSERKAQDVVIRALPQVLQACPDLAYLLVGLPTRRRVLEQLARDLGIQDHVFFLGLVPTEQLPYYYNLADAFVLVSRRTKGEVEGYGIVAVEAALCGVPAIVSRDCGLEEAVVADQTALVVDPNDPEGTAEAIVELLLDDTRRLEMGREANRYARENATWSKRIQAYDGILRNLVAGGDPCVYS